VRVALASVFRNSAGYLGRYFDQVRDLRRGLRLRGGDLRLLLVHGDSDDGTGDDLTRRMMLWNLDGEIREISHGGPMFGSVDVEQRWRQLALVCNAALDLVSVADDALIYVESDLQWSTHTMLTLLDDLRQGLAVAPLCLHSSGFFYDTWGHRKNGRRFDPQAPFHPDINLHGLTEIDSAGSCVVMLGAAARDPGVRFGETDCIVGLGRSLWAQGYRLMLDARVSVVHP